MIRAPPWIQITTGRTVSAEVPYTSALISQLPTVLYVKVFLFPGAWPARTMRGRVRAAGVLARSFRKARRFRHPDIRLLLSPKSLREAYDPLYHTGPWGRCIAISAV